MTCGSALEALLRVPSISASAQDAAGNTPLNSLLENCGSHHDGELLEPVRILLRHRGVADAAKVANALGETPEQVAERKELNQVLVLLRGAGGGPVPRPESSTTPTLPPPTAEQIRESHDDALDGLDLSVSRPRTTDHGPPLPLTTDCHWPLTTTGHH